jgi:hypothetical protein
LPRHVPGLELHALEAQDAAEQETDAGDLAVPGLQSLTPQACNHVRKALLS